MFKADITDTPFTTSAANMIFHNIYGSKYRNDNSFVATMRALLAPRIKEDDEVGLSFSRSNYNEAQLRSAGSETVINALIGSIDLSTNGQIHIHNLSSDTTSNAFALSCIREKFVDIYPDYVLLERITAFYKKAFEVLCFINEERKSVVVFVDRLDNKKLHYLQCSILAMMPWYFDKEAGITALEMELIKSLRESSPDIYIATMKELAQQYDFKTEKVKRLLTGFDTKIDRITLDHLKREASNYDEEVRNHSRRINDLLKAKDDVVIRIMGLTQRINEKSNEDSEIMQYFLCNKSLYLNNVEDDYLGFSVKSYISYFDPEMAESIINNTRSCIYNRAPQGEIEDIKRLLSEIFLNDNPRLHIITCAAYRLEMHGTIHAISGYQFDADFSDAIPNTHIQNYRCLGNYTTAINQLMESGDYIGGIEQCIASCKSLNFGDSVVISDFFAYLFTGSGCNNRCIELPNGSVVDYKKAIQWLKENGEA